MAVSIRLSADGRTADFGSPVSLFPTRIFGDPVLPNMQYAVSLDGTRFLIHKVRFPPLSVGSRVPPGLTKFLGVSFEAFEFAESFVDGQL